MTVSLTTAGCPIRGHFQGAVRDAVMGLEGVRSVNVDFDVMTSSRRRRCAASSAAASCPRARSRRSQNVVCIGSGKGGVGKSTLTANLAAALRARGQAASAMLDADVWGYSIPRMLGLGAERAGGLAERKIIPLEAGGIKVMSIGFFVEEDAAVVWRGPMLHKALKQFLEDVDWGALDFLLIDLPPGTGDVSMTLAQLLPQATFVIVTTPQAAAQRVARRSAEMANKVVARDLRRDREHVRLRHAGRRALRDLRRGRRPGARRRARRAAARQGAADDAAARAVRRRRAAGRRRIPTTRPRRRSARPRAA